MNKLDRLYRYASGELLSHIEHYRLAVAALEIQPDDETMESKRRAAMNAIFDSISDGAFVVTDYDVWAPTKIDGQDVAVRFKRARYPTKRNRKALEDWLKMRGVESNLDALDEEQWQALEEFETTDQLPDSIFNVVKPVFDSVEQALEAGDHVPEEIFDLVVANVEVRRSPSLKGPEMTVLKGHKNPFGAIEDDSSNEILIEDDSSKESLAAPNSDEKPNGDFRLAAFELLLLRLVAKGPLMVSEHARHPKPNPSARANTEIRKVLLLVYCFKQLEQIVRVENPSKEYRLKLEKLRGKEAQAIIGFIDVVISFEPSCVTYNLGNEFVLSLGNGVELAIYQYVANVMPRGNGRKKALAWLRSRGENPDLKILHAAIGRAVAARESLPDKAFGLLRPAITLRPNPLYEESQHINQK